MPNCRARRENIGKTNSENLEKKSKLRTTFEKHKNFISIAFYPDNDQTLLNLASNFFKTIRLVFPIFSLLALKFDIF